MLIVAVDASEDVGPTHRRVADRTDYVGLTWLSVVLVVASVVSAFVLRDAFVAAHRTVGWVIACAIVALLIDPLVDALDRRLPRVIAVIAVLVGIVAVVAAVGFGLVRNVLDSLDELSVSAPRAAAELEEQYTWAADVSLGERVQTFVDRLDENVRGDALNEAASAAPTYLVTGILMLFLLAGGRRYTDAFVAQFSPERGRMIAGVLGRAATRGRAYLLFAIAHAIVNGVVVTAACWLLDLPAPVSLGVCVAAMSLLPLIGVLVGGVPALLLAAGLEGWPTGAVVGLLLIALQAIEIAVVRPWVDRRTVRVGPTVPIVVGLLGFELYGVGGAVYGLALAVIGLAALDALGQARGEEPEAEPA